LVKVPDHRQAFRQGNAVAILAFLCCGILYSNNSVSAFEQGLDQHQWCKGELRFEKRTLCLNNSSSLKTIGESILNLVNGVPNFSKTSDVKQVDDSAIQLLVPAMAWDWESTVTGITPREQYQFSDHMPQSCAPHVQFASSSASFSENYKAFLNVLAPNFQPENILKDAESKLKPPDSKPADSLTPTGWTKVKDGSGLLRWQPDWIVSQTPRDWIARVATKGGNSGTIKLNMTVSPGSNDTSGGEQLLKFQSDDGKWQSITLKSGQVKNIEISAEAWDRIPVYPGEWYSSAIIGFGRNGPFRYGYESSQFFGNKGLLSCRVSELVVAYKPKFKMDVDDSFLGKHNQKLLKAIELQVAGFAFKKSANGSAGVLIHSEKTIVGTTQYSASSTSSTPLIVGVIIEKIN